MRNFSGRFHSIRQLASMLLKLSADAWRFLVLCLRPARALAAEILFLRKQFALYEERQVKPRRAANATRLAMVWLSHCFEWRPALGLVKPDTFIRNHAKGIVACDFCVVVTATFRTICVFVMIEHANRRLLHVNVSDHPTAQWTMQQFREAIPSDHEYRFLIHDRDSIFSKQVDQGVRNMGLRVLKTPVRTPVANSICERVIGTMRRECLDFMIPLNQRHLYRILKEWVAHYNESRPHKSLGPGIPQPRPGLTVSRQAHRHRISTGQQVVSQPILNGLHHEYRLEQMAA